MPLEFKVHTIVKGRNQMIKEQKVGIKGYKSHDKFVFGCVVLVLVLVNQPYPGPVVGLTSCKQGQ
jgi:hypothetical protein